MRNFESHLICEDAIVLDALERLNSFKEETLTLFVCDISGKMIGSLTDGDIRRGLLKGLDVSKSIVCFMAKSFFSVKIDDFSIEEIKEIRSKGIKLLPALDKDGRIVKVYDLSRLKSILPLECLIMAGGKGERLRPLTENVPKPMLMIGDKPILEHNIDRIKAFGIEKINISIKYLGNQIKDYFGDGKQKGISITYVEEDKFLGTGGALRLIDNYSTDYILVMNSDLFTDIDFEDLYLNTINSNASIGIASIPYTVNIPYAIFERKGNEIISFKEKPSNTHYANAGIYIIKKELIQDIPKNEFFNITELIQLVLDRGEKVIQNPIYGYWIDIGKHEDYHKANEIAKHMQ